MRRTMPVAPASQRPRRTGGWLLAVQLALFVTGAGALVLALWRCRSFYVPGRMNRACARRPTTGPWFPSPVGSQEPSRATALADGPVDY